MYKRQDVLKVIKDALDATDTTKLSISDVYDVALQAVTDSELSDDKKKAFRTRIGALSLMGEFSPYVQASSGSAIAGTLHIGPTIPDGATEIEFTIVADTTQFVTYDTRTVSVTSILSLPNRTANSNAISNGSGILPTAFDQRDTLTPGVLSLIHI